MSSLKKDSSETYLSGENDGLGLEGATLKWNQVVEIVDKGNQKESSTSPSTSLVADEASTVVNSEVLAIMAIAYSNFAMWLSVSQRASWWWVLVLLPQARRHFLPVLKIFFIVLQYLTSFVLAVSSWWNGMGRGENCYVKRTILSWWEWTLAFDLLCSQVSVIKAFSWLVSWMTL